MCVFIVNFLATKKKIHVTNADVLFVMLVLIITAMEADTCEQHLTSTHSVSYEWDFEGSFFSSWIRICHFHFHFSSLLLEISFYCLL